jgi:hypothetical protein
MLLLGALGSASFEATGGTITTYSSGGVDYKVHSFTTTGNSTFQVFAGGDVECVVVAGGGAGGGVINLANDVDPGAPGGGGGGVVTGSFTNLPVGSSYKTSSNVIILG